jgi:hypothetical protein
MIRSLNRERHLFQKDDTSVNKKGSPQRKRPIWKKQKTAGPAPILTFHGVPSQQIKYRFSMSLSLKTAASTKYYIIHQRTLLFEQ